MNVKLPLDNLPLPDLPQDIPAVDPLVRERTLSDRILRYAFVASVVVNFGWIFWVAHSDIFGSGAVPAMRETQIKVFKKLPPKPKEHKVKPPPPPPPPKPQPHIKPPPPLHIVHLQPRPQPIVKQVRVAQTKSQFAKPTFTVPDYTPPPGPVTPAVPSYTPPPEVKGPTADVPPTPPTPPTPPAVEHHDAPPVEVHHDPPAPPVEVHRQGWREVKSEDAGPVGGDFEQPDLSGIDTSGVASKEVTISFEIDETGHVRHAHVAKSCGDPDIDQKCVDAISRTHCKPAIQDHYPQVSQQRYTYPLN